MHKTEKLYTVSSDVGEFKDRKDVIVDWWKADSRWQDMDYGLLIENYHLLDETDKCNAEAMVSEFFTIDEIELLRDFFRKRVGEPMLSVTEVPIPIRYKDFNTGETYRRLCELPRDENVICLNCCFIEDYDLPFGVWGFFNLDNHCPAEELPGEHVKNGLRFLDKALAAAFPKLDCSQILTSELVNGLYEEYGLYVDLNVDKIFQEAA